MPALLLALLLVLLAPLAPARAQELPCEECAECGEPMPGKAGYCSPECKAAADETLYAQARADARAAVEQRRAERAARRRELDARARRRAVLLVGAVGVFIAASLAWHSLRGRAGPPRLS